MQAIYPAGLSILLSIAALLLPPAAVHGGFPAVLTLERAFPTSHGVELSQLRDRDRVRHRRILQSASVINFPVQGTYNPYLVGLYFTTVQLGSPPQDFYVQIDTGSDVLWVTCNPCNGCPTSSGLKIPMNFFNPSSSSSSQLISCSDQRCALGAKSSESSCSSNQCSYSFQYGDGSGTSGYYVSDMMQLDEIVSNSSTSNSSSRITFGCSTSETGDLQQSNRAVDGIFGFGQQGLSVITQLASQGVAPNSFSHCLKGSNGGGGILVLGEIVEPNIVYSPLVPSQPHYNLNMQSISVNGQTLPIAQSVFATSSTSGTIVDSGTTLAYLAQEAYDPFVTAITNSTSQSVSSVVYKGNQCYLVTSSVSDSFPSVSLNFVGGAAMVLKPEDYLIQQTSTGGASLWCIGFQQIQGQSITILGDLVLKDKIIVYDLDGQRIGWVDYDCSKPVNVSATSSTGKSEYVNAGEMSENSSSQNSPFNMIIPTLIIALLSLAISL